MEAPFFISKIAFIVYLVFLSARCSADRKQAAGCRGRNIPMRDGLSRSQTGLTLTGKLFPGAVFFSSPKQEKLQIN